MGRSDRDEHFDEDEAPRARRRAVSRPEDDDDDRPRRRQRPSREEDDDDYDRRGPRPRSGRNVMALAGYYCGFLAVIFSLGGFALLVVLTMSNPRIFDRQEWRS